MLNQLAGGLLKVDLFGSASQSGIASNVGAREKSVAYSSGLDAMTDND